MADVLTLRAEIKAWERSFKDENGAPPTIEDIKNNPPIAEKYKQYKRLSKAATSSSSNHIQPTASTPSTPPRPTRPKQPTSALLSRTRLVQPTASLASFNPFSPQKKQKGKERETDGSLTSQEARHKPSTSKLHGGLQQRQLFSLEPNPSTLQSNSSSTIPSSLQLKPHAEPASAVSRARKRLRGEPVSPSPNKDKRRRVLSQTTLPFPRLNLDAPSSDEDEELHDADSSFVDNSPVKFTSTGKLFPSLFEEKLVPMDLFGVKSNLGLSNYSSGSQSGKASAEHPKASKRVPSSKALPGLTKEGVEPDHVLSKTASKPLREMDGKKGQESQTEYEASRASSKRSLSGDEDDATPHSASFRARSPLLPPSPPPSTNVTSYNEAGKKKARAKNAMNKSRKKAKMNEATSPGPDSDEEESSTKLRIVGRNTMRQYHTSNEDDEGISSDLDAVLGSTRFTGPHGMSPAETRQEEGIVDIDLPDKLRDVLALESATLKARASQEDSLVKGLLYGRRVTHYNPQKGGEIWDVGEDEHDDAEAGRYTEGEDDWEGEPVPWEAAEL